MLNKNKTYILAPNIKKEVGGTADSTISLSKLLSKKFETELVCVEHDLNPGNENFRITTPSLNSKNFVLMFINFYKYLKSNIKGKSIVHVQNIWGIHSIVPYFLKFKKNFILIYSTRGTLDRFALKYSRTKKLIFYNFMFQKKSLKAADYFHATSIKEYKEIRRMGFKQPVAIIPNPIKKTNIFNDEKKKVITFIGRIHPIKGIDLLLEAWKEIHNEMNFSLNIFGVWEDESYIEKLKLYIKKHNLNGVKVNGPVYGQKKNNIYQESSFCIFPSYTENFGNSIGESLMNGTPVIVSKNTPWQKVTKKQCGYVCDLDVKSLKNTLIEINSLSRSEIINLGNNGRKFALEEFSYDVVRNSFYSFYNWIINKDKNIPDFIRFK